MIPEEIVAKLFGVQFLLVPRRKNVISDWDINILLKKAKGSRVTLETRSMEDLLSMTPFPLLIATGNRAPEITVIQDIPCSLELMIKKSYFLQG